MIAKKAGRLLRIMIPILFILFLILVIATTPVRASQEDAEVYEAYEAILDAYKAGGNVKDLVEKLNKALELLSMADQIEDENPREAERLRAEARQLLKSIIEEAPRVAEEGRYRTLIHNIILGSSIAGFVFACIITYKAGPKIFWRLWIKLRRNYRIKPRVVIKKSQSMLLSEEVWAVIAAIIIVASVFAVSQIIWSSRVVEPFSAIGVLGPHKKIGDYPREVFVGEPFTLYVYVHNYMGKPMLYEVMIKLVNQSVQITQTNPAPVEPMMTFRHALLHNETWIFPVNITLTEPGTKWRLVFELWAYNPDTDKVEYLGLWCHLWLNVTEIS